MKHDASGTPYGGVRRKRTDIVTESELRGMQLEAMSLQAACFMNLDDETINRAMKTVVRHLMKYVEAASKSKTKAITVAETEIYGHESEF